MKESNEVTPWTLREVSRLTNDFYKAGLLKKKMRNGVEMFQVDLSYVERAKELMKDGKEIHAAYHQAIAEQCPRLACEDILQIMAERVHEKPYSHNPAESLPKRYSCKRA